MQLYPSERSVLVDLAAHHGQGGGVAIVPEARGDQRRLVGVGADRCVFGTHGRPTALFLDRPMSSLRERLRGAEAGAVWDLVEAVAKSLRPDSNRLEQDVMPRVSRHSSPR